MKKPLVILILLFALIYSKRSIAQTPCEADHTILLTNFTFTPSELTIIPGESVAFINVEGQHTVNGINNTVTGMPFNNPFEFFLEETEGNSQGVCMGVVTFEEAGTYNFDCSIGFHAQLGMTGQIIADAFTLSDALIPGSNYIPDAFQSSYSLYVYYDSLLNSNNDYTVFVPNDQAVDDVKELMNLGQFDLLSFFDLQTALGYHIADGTWASNQLTDGLSLSTLQGQSLSISEENGVFKVDDAQIIATDYFADNGVIHIIDKCLAPSGYPKATVWDIIKDSPDHNYLETAIINSGLVETLREQDELDDNVELAGPFTLFAPTDSALENLAEERGETIEELIEGQYIDKIVKNHLIENRFLSNTLSNGQQLQNFLNEFIQVSIENSILSIEDIPVSEADVKAYNGVVHIIESTIVPDLPPVSGSCGTWSLVMKSADGIGWGESYLDIVVDGQSISTETLISGFSSTYQFGVDLEEEVSIYFVNGAGGSSISYELYNSSNQLLFASQNQGNSNYPPGNIVGLKACSKTSETCGQFRVEMYDDYGDGWDFGSLSININSEFYASYNMPVGNAQFFYVPANIGDEIDFIYQAGAFSEENSFIVYDPQGEEILNEFDPFAAPSSAYGIIACQELTSTDETELSTESLIYPNPSSDKLYIQTNKEIDRIIIYDLNGRELSNKAYNNEAIDVGFLKTSHYILSLRGKTSSEFLKFSIIK